MRKNVGFIMAALGATFCATAASAHPHVFAQARMELQATPDGLIDQLNHVWRFDELFTATVILEFDADQNGELGDAELDEVANIIAGSIADFNYFQNLEVKGKDVGFERVEEMIVGVEDGQLLVLFATVPDAPVKLMDEPKIGIFDPTFYTAIEFYSERDMVIIDAPKGCAHAMVIPDPDEAIAENSQSLTEAFYDPNDTNDMSKILATRMEVSCS
ncbi:MAG: DUF1007 family protein [Pseudomonadota bacterium]